MIELIAIAIVVAVALLAFIVLLDIFVLRPRNANTARKIREAEEAEAERRPMVLKDTTGDSSWNDVGPL